MNSCQDPPPQADAMDAREQLRRLLLKKVSTTPQSFGQRRLWFVEGLDISDVAYTHFQAIRLHGVLDLEALKRSFTRLVERHEILRTTFDDGDDGPVQVVHPAAGFLLQTNDLSRLPAAQLPLASAQLIDEERARPFDLRRGPLLRCRILICAEREHIMLLALHHIVVDGWSAEILFRELSTLYRGYRGGAPVELEALAVQYADFALWQQEWVDSAASLRQLDYWRAQLAGMQPLQLPYDRARGAVQTFAGSRCTRRVGLEVSERLKSLSRRQGSTLFMTLLAGFAVLMHRYSQQTDVVIGSPIANRGQKELEGLIGFFVNTLVMRCDLSGNPGFDVLLERLRETALQAYAHQDLPFEKLVEELEPQRDLSKNPLFQVTFSLHGEPLEALQLEAVMATRVPVSAPVTHFDLDCHVMETDAGLSIGFEYNLALFDAATVERMLATYLHLLETLSVSPQLDVGSAALLAEPERRLLLECWTDTARPCDEAATIVSMFARAALQQPRALALEYCAQTLSYGELDCASNRMARRLQRLGVTPGATVGVLLDRSVEMLVAWLAAMKAGAAYLPLDPEYPPARLQYMLRDSAAPVLVTHPDCIAQVPAYQGERLYTNGDWSQEDAAAVSIPVEPETVAYLIYTSGSTGEPKGVAVEHRALANLLQWHNREYAVTVSDRATQLAGVSFDASVWEVWPYLAVGASVHIVEEGLRHAPLELWRWLAEQQITLAFVPTPLAQAMLGEALPQGLALRALLTGGDRLHAGRLPRTLPFRLMNHYGPTENAVVSSYAEVDLAAADEQLPPIGRPIDNVCAYVLDERLQPLPLGAVGELFVGGRSLARGYRGQPELTAEKFVKNPFSSDGQARLYCTGDLVRWRADGQLEFIGRRDEQVKIRGFRIETAEIEAVLDAHPLVQQSVVLCREDVPGDKRLAGYYLADSDVTLSDQQLREHIAERMPRYMVPASLQRLAAIPLTANGKVDRDALPIPASDIDEAAFVAPGTPNEALLAEIWAEVLRVERVSVADNFFELGGDSIMSMQIVTRARRAGLGLTSKQIFQRQTVAELAAVAVSAQGTDASPQAAPQGEVGLTPIQQWFFAQPMSQRSHFNQSVLLQLCEPLDEALLARALGALVARHDAIRSRFIRAADGWHQQPGDNEGYELLTRFELRTSTSNQCQRQFRQIAADLHGSLDLAAGVLIRAALVEFEDHTPAQILIVIHHLVVDGVSWQVLLEDFEMLCRQMLQGQQARLPERGSSIGAITSALEAYAGSEPALAQLDHWLSVSRGCQDLLWQDAGVPASGNQWGDARSVEVQLSVPETQRLLVDVARRFRVRINDVLLAALALTLAEASGRTTVHVNLEGHGREDDLLGLDSTRTVGWFTSLYPVALSPRVGDVVATLGAIRRQLEQIPDSGLGFGCLRYLCPDAGVREQLASMPTAQISFNYRGHVDQAFSEGALFRMLPDDAMAALESHTPRAHLIDVSGRVLERRMTFRWFYSPALHEAATVEGWAQRFVTHLRDIVDACDQPGLRAPGPDDYPLSALTAEQLQRLLQAHGDVQDIYPTTALQSGILFRALESSTPGVYLPQFIFELNGTLDVKNFERAWQLLVERHDILRTAFAWVGLVHPVQVVGERAQVALRCDDWSHIETSREAAALEEFLGQDLARGIAVDVAPLMRLTLIRRDASRWLLVWTAHHLVLDGWCLPLILSEVLDHYRGLCHGEAPQLQPAPAFRDYIEWLQRVDASSARQFWQTQLAGYRQPLDLGIGDMPGESDAATHAEVRHDLSAALTGRMQRLARDARVTLNTLLQGAWALLLNRYSGESDIVFGVTVSGRSAEVAGIDSMLGLFINGLPIRVDVAGDALLQPWLAELQREQVEARQYESTSLLQIQEWIGWTGTSPLFESVVVFENYPLQGVFDRDADDLQLRYSSSRGWTDVPLEVIVIPGERLCIRIKYDQRRFDREEVEQLLEHYAGLLNAMVCEPSRNLASFSMKILDGDPSTSVNRTTG